MILAAYWQNEVIMQIAYCPASLLVFTVRLRCKDEKKFSIAYILHDTMLLNFFAYLSIILVNLCLVNRTVGPVLENGRSGARGSPPPPPPPFPQFLDRTET